jgi:hypothetical protein
VVKRTVRRKGEGNRHFADGQIRKLQEIASNRISDVVPDPFEAITLGCQTSFQMAEVAIPRHFFADILRLIAALRPPPDPAVA